MLVGLTVAAVLLGIVESRAVGGDADDPGQVALGAQIYGEACASCHQADGSGMHALGAPNLTDNTWLFGSARGHIETSIAEGRSGIMPPHKELLGENKVHILAAYVYSLSQN